MSKQRPAKKSEKREVRVPKNEAGLTGWIGKETSLAAKGGPVVIGHEGDAQVIDKPAGDSVSRVPPSTSSVDGEELDEETRELS